MSSRTVWERWAQYRPEPVEEWIVVRTRAEIVTELDLCSVPLDATPKQACALLECNGVWAIPPAVQQALRYRREHITHAN